MGIAACPECGQNISTNADTCPSCGYPIKKTRKAKASQLGCLALLVPIGFIAILIASHSPSENEKADEKQRQQALDVSTDPLESCDYKLVPSLMGGIDLVSWSDASKVCELAKSSLQLPIPIGVFRFLLNAAGLLHIKGAGELDQIAYQIIEIIDARDLTDPQRMKDTIDIVFKAYTGSNGRVTPKDLNVAIRQSKMGRTLSDKGLYGVAALISVQKRNKGE
jgi:hypothetical protein